MRLRVKIIWDMGVNESIVWVGFLGPQYGKDSPFNEVMYVMSPLLLCVGLLAFGSDTEERL